MPKRPESHIQQTKAELEFERIINTFGWTATKMVPDYGIDYEVRIFENEIATEFVFYVQLKSIKRIKKNKHGMLFSIETKYLDFYEKQTYPVMIVIYDASLNSLLYEWTHLIKFAFSPSKYLEKLRKKTISFFIKNTLDENHAGNIFEFIKGYFFSHELTF